MAPSTARGDNRALGSRLQISIGVAIGAATDKVGLWIALEWSSGPPSKRSTAVEASGATKARTNARRSRPAPYGMILPT